jgi:hypothetical protein
MVIVLDINIGLWLWKKVWLFLYPQADRLASDCSDAVDLVNAPGVGN